jgi:hypothetical protein
MEITDIAAPIGRLIQARAGDLDLEILECQTDILKSYTVDENFWHLVDRVKFCSLKSAA